MSTEKIINSTFNSTCRIPCRSSIALAVYRGKKSKESSKGKIEEIPKQKKSHKLSD